MFIIPYKKVAVVASENVTVFPQIGIWWAGGCYIVTFEQILVHINK